MLAQKTVHQQSFYIYAFGLVCYLLFYLSSIPMDYSLNDLYDGNQYSRVYKYFEFGWVQQSKFPYCNRVLIPWLASLVPGSDIKLGFDLVNFFFFLLGMVATRQLWLELKLSFAMQILGFAWLYLHWTGIIRYNLHDYITVDVPIYCFQAWALLCFLRKKYGWFYVITPLALLQRESFLAVVLVLIVSHFYFEREKKPRQQGAHLIGALLFGVLLQYLILLPMPEQSDNRSSIGAILFHGRWALEDPTRFARWFAAFGSAFGLLPFVALFRFRIKRMLDQPYATLVVLSLMYCFFGLLAGEDMTRILFLGFPFLMTLSLLELNMVSRKVLWLSLALSLVSLRLYPLYVDIDWAVDYAALPYVWRWFAYYATAGALLALVYFRNRENPSR